MNAQEKVLEYARKYNDEKVYTDQQFAGKLFVDGIVINRTGGTVVSAHGRREGTTIIITETTREDTPYGKKETTTEVMRVEI